MSSLHSPFNGKHQESSDNGELVMGYLSAEGSSKTPYRFSKLGIEEGTETFCIRGNDGWQGNEEVLAGDV